jgi:hypothetical protein
MNSLINFALFFLLLIGFFSFSKKEENPIIVKSNLYKMNVIDVLTKQEYQCRPSSRFMFYVKTNLVKKSRGANTIHANIYVLDRLSGDTNLLASENIFVPSYEDAISLERNTFISHCGKSVLENGLVITIEDAKNAPYCFNELIQFKSICRSYMYSKNKLLQLKNF